MPRSFDLKKMQLTLDGNVVNMYHFADEPDMPWFQAKPITVHLGLHAGDIRIRPRAQ